MHNVCNAGLVLMLCCLSLFARGQDDSAAAKKPEKQSLIYLKYLVKDNGVPYLQVQTKNKLEEGFESVGNVPVDVFLDDDSSGAIAKVTTDSKGEASFGLDPAIATRWTSHPTHTFYAHSKAAGTFDAVEGELTVTAAKIQLDTLNEEGVRSIKATVLKKTGDSWEPMPEVDVRLGVRRLGGLLPIGSEESYTTDSVGAVTGEFSREKLPGDTRGNLAVVAFVDDNDEIGTIQSSITLPWGVATTYTNSAFGKRSLWATGNLAPGWLILLASICIVSVWSVIIYLVTQILKIKKLGLQAQRENG